MILNCHCEHAMLHICGYVKGNLPTKRSKSLHFIFLPWFHHNWWCSRISSGHHSNTILTNSRQVVNSQKTIQSGRHHGIALRHLFWIIIVTSHKRAGVAISRPLGFLFSSFLGLSSTRNPKPRITGPLGLECIGDQWFPLTKDQWCGKRFYVMTSSWFRKKNYHIIKGVIGADSDVNISTQECSDVTCMSCVQPPLKGFRVGLVHYNPSTTLLLVVASSCINNALWQESDSVLI